jgi:CBS domain-containing protein
MTTDLIIVRRTDSLRVAADAFRKNNIHHLPVVDEQGRLAGIFSKSDYLRVSSAWTAFRKKGEGEDLDRYSDHITIGDVMVRDVVRLMPGDPISVAVGIFKENLFHSIPIVERDMLVGIVTTYDLLQYAFEENGIV